MRLEALNHAELACELARIDRAVPIISEKVRILGTDEGPQAYRYSATAGLDLLERIEQVGELRHRMFTVALPALEKRRQEVDRLITGYPKRLQKAEERFSRMREQSDRYTPDELSLAEQALLAARAQFQAPSIEEVAKEVTAPKPFFLHLSIINGGDKVITTIISEGAEPKVGRVVRLTRDEVRVLDVLARARIMEQRRLRPAELADRAFPGQSATEVSLSLVMVGLRAKLNSPGNEFINSKGAIRGQGVLYGIAEDVFIKSEALQQEKERAERLDKLRKLIIERKGTNQAAVFEQLVENLGKKVAFESTQALREIIYNLRAKLVNVNIVIDGFKYKIRTFRTRTRGLSYSLEEVQVPAPKMVEGEKISEEVVTVEVVEDVEVPKVVPSQPLLDTKPRDPYQQIKRRDPDIIGKLEELAAKVVDSGVEDDFEVPQIEAIFGVPDHIVEKAIEDRQVRVSGFEGHHGKISPGEAVFLAALVGYESNLTPVERRQLRKLAKTILATAFNEKEKNGNKGKNKRRKARF